MTDEPKKLIEAHLEAHAAQRRLAAGGAFELDDAARLRLLTEVERVHGLVETPIHETPATAMPPAFQPLFPFQPQAVAEPLATAPIQEEIVSPVLPQTTAQEIVQEVSLPVAAALPAEDEALRQTLQAELQRTESPKETVAAEEPSGPSAWTMLWTRLAFSFGAVALIGLAAFIVRLQIPADGPAGALAKLEPASGDTLAVGAGIAPVEATTLNESAAATTNAASLALAGTASTAAPLIAANDPVAAVVPSVSPERDLLRRQLTAAELREQTRGEMASRSPAPVVAAPASNPAVAPPERADKARLPEGRGSEVRLEAATAKAELKAAPSQPMPAAPAPIATRTMVADAMPAALREGSFMQQTVPSGIRRNLQSPRKPDVLTSFRVELVAGTVQLVDRDGSVYVGRPVGGDGSVRFTAAGASRTLGRSVTIDASFVQPDAGTTGGSIRGRISLGNSRWWEFEAVSR